MQNEQKLILCLLWLVHINENHSFKKSDSIPQGRTTVAQADDDQTNVLQSSAIADAAWNSKSLLLLQKIFHATAPEMLDVSCHAVHSMVQSQADKDTESSTLSRLRMLYQPAWGPTQFSSLTFWLRPMCTCCLYGTETIHREEPDLPCLGDSRLLQPLLSICV